VISWVRLSNGFAIVAWTRFVKGLSALNHGAGQVPRWHKLRWLGLLPLLGAAALAAEQRWVSAGDSRWSTDGRVQAFNLPNPGSGPTTVAIAPDGKVWFTEGQGNRIGRINPDGSGYQGFALPHPDSAPRIIALGADGNMWFSEHNGNRIGRITPQGVITSFPIPTTASQPRAIALGADGSIWFGEFAAGKIGRITPQGQITEFALPTPDSGPRALAAGPDGNIWYSAFRASKIGRITPQGVVTEFALPRPNSGPGDITAGADGAMWFVELSGNMDGVQADGGRIGRITMDGRISEFALSAPTPSPINIAVGPDRNIWYTRGAAVGRVTPDGRITEYPLGEGSRGSGLSAGSDRQLPARLVNRLYVADSGANRIAWLEFGTP
jgi:virginiamycin B lyase